MTILAPLLVLLAAVPVRAKGPSPQALSSYSFDPSRPLEARVETIPPWLLKLWSDGDKRPDYAPYLPTAAERKQFEAALDGLPPRMKKVLGERQIAFYFVKNLQGNGITDWVMDSSSRTFVYTVLNPAGFGMDVSRLLTERERSPFRGAADVRVEAGADNGILYTVTHEAAHAFDYVRGLTPYVEPRLPDRRGPGAPKGWDAWRSYAIARNDDAYPARPNLKFYGFGGGPKLDAAEAPAACAQWARSPFASLYGSRNWADDVAELFVARHFAEDLKLPYRYHCAGTTREPMSDPRVRARADRILAPIYGL